MKRNILFFSLLSLVVSQFTIHAQPHQANDPVIPFGQRCLRHTRSRTELAGLGALQTVTGAYWMIPSLLGVAASCALIGGSFRAIKENSASFLITAPLGLGLLPISALGAMASVTCMYEGAKNFKKIFNYSDYLRESQGKHKCPRPLIQIARGR